MRQNQPTMPPWQTVLLVVASIATVVLIAFLLAQMDSLQQRSAVTPNNLPVVELEATLATRELSTIYLPVDVSLTPALAAMTPQATEDAAGTEPPKPSTATHSACASIQEGWIPYAIKAKDTITSLATQFDVSEAAILDANCLSHSQIVEGQQILLPQFRKHDTRATECDTPPGWIPYTSSLGDSLPKLARSHGASAYLLMKYNCLERPKLEIGQVIMLPAYPPAKGDTAADSSRQPAQPDVQNQSSSWPVATPTFAPIP